MEQLIKEYVSKHIPDTAMGIFLRELIFSNSQVDWPAVEQLIYKHFPESRGTLIAK